MSFADRARIFRLIASVASSGHSEHNGTMVTTRSDVPAGEPIRIGDLVVIPIFDGVTRSSATTFYRLRADEPERLGFRIEDWAPHRDLLDDNDTFEHVYGGFLVRSGDRRVLVDAGIGPHQIGPYGFDHRVMRGGALLASLAAHGLEPVDITDVVLTHLHPDHFGWAVANNATTFPNATVRCHALDWAHFVTDPPGPPAGFASALPALEARLEAWDRDGPILPNIDARLTPGHTPGSTTIVLSSGTARGLLLGDVVHCPVELLDSEWASLGDVDPDLAQRTKVALAAELERSATPFTASHFPGMLFGRLVPAEGQRRWVVDGGAA